MANLDLINEIHRIDEDIAVCRNKLKDLRAEMKDAIADTAAGDEIERLTEELKIARDRLKIQLKGHPRYAKLAAEEEAVRVNLQDLQEVLSYHLIQYHDETKSAQVPLSDAKRAKPVIVTAKLGREEAFQESLFGVEEK